MKRSLTFKKYVATGNDFLFIDARVAVEISLTRAALAKQICDRHFGVGADGLVFVERIEAKTKDSDGAEKATPRYKWDFYNSDGSEAEMCGNATRCMGRWASDALEVSQIEFITKAGLVKTRIEGEMVVSTLDFVHASFTALPFEVNYKKELATLLNTGVPHAVFEVPDLALAPKYKEVIASLRFHPLAGLAGANVTFLQRMGPTHFKTVTFERGVEDFTLSCGTGVLAAAAVGLKGGAPLEADMETPGGRLHVKFGEQFKGVELKGPARLVFSGQVNLQEGHV